MTKPLDEPTLRPPGLVGRLPFYYGWICLVVAAVAMMATLPGRTQGLGLITEALLADLHLERTTYAEMNLWATLLGALFCLPMGRWLDRYGSRFVLTLLALALGLTIWRMSHVTLAGELFLLLVLTRGLGQSSLSVASISLVGKWFQRRISLAMGIYAVVLTMMLATAFGLVGYAVREQGWRNAWEQMAFALLTGFLPLAWLFTRSTPEDYGIASVEAESEPTELKGMTLSAALRTPAFWIFALATSAFSIVISGVGLFNESILQELGFDTETYHITLVVTLLVGLASQLFFGWLGMRCALKRLLAFALVLYGSSLVWLPHVTGLVQLYGNVLLMGAAGGMITFLFFAIWPDTFGRRHLGQVQGAAQLMTVVSSAVGPLIFATCHDRYGTYAPIFYGMAPIVFALAAAAWWAPQPEFDEVRRLELDLVNIATQRPN